jgi:hypothetical protein
MKRLENRHLSAATENETSDMQNIRKSDLKWPLPYFFETFVLACITDSNSGVVSTNFTIEPALRFFSSMKFLENFHTFFGCSGSHASFAVFSSKPMTSQSSVREVEAAFACKPTATINPLTACHCKARRCGLRSRPGVLWRRRSCSIPFFLNLKLFEWSTSHFVFT